MTIPMESSSVVMLLGAGASVDAGLPTMARLVDTCMTRLQEDRSSRRPASRVVEKLKAHFGARGDGRQLDLEVLLEALDALMSRHDNVLSAFLTPKGWAGSALPSNEELVAIKRRIHDVLRKELDIEPARTDYYRTLVHLAVELGGMDIFTLNYDAAVEVACEQSGVAYTDGFDAYWNPSLFEATDRFPVRLHKLHGSLLWYTTANGRMVKVPLRPGTFPAASAHILGTPLHEAMIYPGPGKALHSAPFADLLTNFRRAVRSARLLAVVGCSLRDPHVRRVIVEAMRDNPQLQLSVCDPRPADLLTTCDALFDDDLAFTGFRDRILTFAGGARTFLEQRVLLGHHEFTNHHRAHTADHAKALRLGRFRDATGSAFHLLDKACLHDAWPFVVDTCLRRPRPEFTDAAKHLLSNQGDTRGNQFAVAVVLMASTDPQLRQAAMKAIETTMYPACRHGWCGTGHRLRLILPPDGDAAPLYRGRDTKAAERAVGEAVKDNVTACAHLGRILRHGVYGLEPDHVRAIRELQRRLQRVQTYQIQITEHSRFAAVHLGPDREPESIPIAPGRLRAQLAADLGEDLIPTAW